MNMTNLSEHLEEIRKSQNKIKLELDDLLKYQSGHVETLFNSYLNTKSLLEIVIQLQEEVKRKDEALELISQECAFSEDPIQIEIHRICRNALAKQNPSECSR